MQQGIYRIRNMLDDMRYVGSTQDLEQGLVDRREWLRKNKHYNPHLQNAWNKYGEENFVFEIEEEVKGNSKDLLACEQIYLDKGFELGILYNVMKKAGGGDPGEEANRKISETLMGHEVSKETRGKISRALLGKEVSEETKAKTSKTLMGHEVAPEVRAKIGKGNAKPYPAFYNEKTKEYIPAGHNLLEMCRTHNLTYDAITYMKNGGTNLTKDSWRLATQLEIIKWE